MRLLFALTVFIIATVTPWFVAAGAAALYTLLVPTALELILMGALIDAYYGVISPLPYYTLGATTLVVVGTWAKPYLSFYNGQ